MILLTGHVGSGKSLVSQILSKELNLYLISGDYIRNIIKKLYSEINIRTEEVKNINNAICLEEMKYCIDNKYSIILDRSVSNKKTLSVISSKIELPIILIKLLSSDKENIKRVKDRQKKEEIIIPHYGHQEAKSNVVTEEEYNIIKENKVYDLDDDIYNYFINTNQSLDNLKKCIENIVNDIKNKYIK